MTTSEQVAHAAFIAHYRAHRFEVDVDAKLKEISVRHGNIPDDWRSRYKAMLVCACNDQHSVSRSISSGKARRLIADKYNGVEVARVYDTPITLQLKRDSLYKANKRRAHLFEPGPKDIPPVVVRTADEAIIGHARAHLPSVDVRDCLRRFRDRFDRPMVADRRERRAALMFAACVELDELLNRVSSDERARRFIADRYASVPLSAAGPSIGLKPLTLYRIHRVSAHRQGVEVNAFFKATHRSGRRG